MGGPFLAPRRIGAPIKTTIPDPTTAPRSVQEWNHLSYDELLHRLLPNYRVDIAGWLKSYTTHINKEYTITLDSSNTPVQPELHTQPAASTRPAPSSEDGSDVSDIDDDDQHYSLALEAADTIEDKDFERCFRLVEAGSAADYKKSKQGWSARKKRDEMKLLDMKFLLLKTRRGETELGSIRGFVSFMITVEDEHEVFYVYEVHMAQEIQGKGVGKWMMGQVEKIGKRARLGKAMLTVFRNNDGAMRFYHGLGYETDKFSPEPTRLRGGRTIEADYVILSKVLGVEQEDEEMNGEDEGMKAEDDNDSKVKIEAACEDEAMDSGEYYAKTEKEEQDGEYKIKLEEA